MKMPLCGFNKKMLEGLLSFHEGLVEHGLIARSEKKGLTVDQTLENELSDMDRFLSETYRIADPKKKAIVEALTNYARVFYELIEERGIDDYRDFVKSLNHFYRKMDDKYYSELEGRKDDMAQLATYLNSLKI